MIQLAALIEIDGSVREKINLNFRPVPGRSIEAEALEVNKKTEAEIMAYPPLQIGIMSLKKTLAKYVCRYDKNDKFVPAGFRVDFDCEFIREAFYLSGDQYGIGCWFFNCSIDIRSYVGQANCMRGLRLPTYKLVTICAHYGIELEKIAHDAMPDIEATQRLYHVLRTELGYGK
jgi:DNA polymerase-3 subunit epsilon